MTSGDGAGDALRGNPGPSSPRRGLPLVLIVVLVDAAAAYLVVLDLLRDPLPVERTIVVPVLALVVGGLLHGELTLFAERTRRRVTASGHIDLGSVWTFAAALLLPPIAASAVVLLLYAWSYVRVYAPAEVPLHRHVYTTATVLIAAHGTGAISGWADAPQWWGPAPVGPVLVAMAMVAYAVVQTGLVVVVVALSSQTTFRRVLGSADRVVLEVATLSLGALLAAVIVGAGPWHVLLVLPPLLVLHRAVLVRRLEQAVDVDGKTGLLTLAAWHRRSGARLQRTDRLGGVAALLIVDIDHFKLVNDRHGHLAGDLVLIAVASAVREQVRRDDPVGRFGGEEFVVLLHDRPARVLTRRRIVEIAERIRAAVDGLEVEVPTPDGPLTIRDLSISVGVAVFPDDGVDAERLLAAADTALYTAKHDGRNAVRISRGPEDTPRPRPPVD